MKTHRMELLKEGTDSQGDTFTHGCLEFVAEVFKGKSSRSIPVTMGFDPRALPVGHIVGLDVEGDRLMADIEVDELGDAAVEKGFKLACGGIVSSQDKQIQEFDLTSAALTDSKVE